MLSDIGTLADGSYLDCATSLSWGGHIPKILLYISQDCQYLRKLKSALLQIIYPRLTSLLLLGFYLEALVLCRRKQVAML